MIRCSYSDEIIPFWENSVKIFGEKIERDTGSLSSELRWNLFRFGFPNDRLLFAYLNGRAQQEQQQQLAVFNSPRGSKQSNFHQKFTEHFGTENNWPKPMHSSLFFKVKLKNVKVKLFPRFRIWNPAIFLVSWNRIERIKKNEILKFSLYLFISIYIYILYSIYIIYIILYSIYYIYSYIFYIYIYIS